MAQAGASRFGEAFDVAPCEQVARHLAVLFERRDHPQRFVALGFDIVERSPEHGRVANGAIGKSPIQALDFAFLSRAASCAAPWLWRRSLRSYSERDRADPVAASSAAGERECALRGYRR